MAGIRVTIEDLEAGTSETTEVWNDFLLVCAGNRHLARVDSYANGTAVLTIKKEAS